MTPSLPLRSKSPRTLVLGVAASLIAGAALTLAATANLAAASDGPELGISAKGIINTMPAGSLYGTWTISGTTYEAVAGVTQFRMDDGMLSVGKCAEVNYQLRNTSRVALRVRSDDSCAGGNGGGESEGSQLAEFKGPINSFPADLIGAWSIGGRAFTATESTHFEQKSGPFATGQCVEVKTALNSADAIEIESHPFCGEGPTLARARGLISVLPVSGTNLLGTWTVATTTYEVISSTLLDRSHGEFAVGTCVNVYYNNADPARTARKVESQSLDECAPRTVSGTLEARGLVSTQPPTGTVFGEWTIGGQAYQAVSGTTRFNNEHGQLTIGDCAKVKYVMQGAARVATRLSSESAHECGALGEAREAFGAIRAIPAGGRDGIWQIGEGSYVVTTATKLSGPFAIGALVEVKFTRQADGTLAALKIERKNGSEGERRIGKSQGLISTRPATPTIEGTWVIASNTYSVTSSTRVTGTLNTGDCAEVYYTLVGSARVALKIKGENAAECAADAEGKLVSEAYGFVTEMPNAGFVGTWVVGGSTYESNAATLFGEKRGALTTGAFVEVHYVITNGVRSAIKIEAKTPPNAGERTEIGEVKVISGVPTVNGQPITITPETMIDDAQGEFKDGAKVFVNLTNVVSAAQAQAAGANGALPATKILVVRALYRVTLPTIAMN
jgi:hypothetical protein